MSHLINPFLLDRNAIVSVENPVALSTPSGVAFGSLVFQSTVRCKTSRGFYRQVPVSYSAGSYNSATPGPYTLVGTLAPTGDVTNPLGLTASIVVWVMPAHHFWIDFVDKAKMVGAIDNITRIITQATGKTYASAVQYDAVLLKRPSWNGEGVYFNTQSAMKSGNSSSFEAYYNGTQFTQYFVWKQLEVPNTHIGPIVDMTDGSSASKGISVYIDNRASSGFTNTLYVLIARGVSGQAPIVLHSSNNAVVQDAWNWAKVTYDGVNVTLYCNGVQVAQAAPSYAFGTGAATNVMSIGNKATWALQAGMRGYLKHIFWKNSLMSAGDQVVCDAWATAMCGENLVVDDYNLYAKIGQSNNSGRGNNASIASVLNGRVGAMIMVPKPTPPTQTDGTGSINSDSYWEELELGRNQTIESVATQHGSEMRFGYEMHRHNENCGIVKLGVGGTPIYSTATYNDWNVSSGQLYTQYYGMLVTAMDEIKHVFRKNPVWRGLTIMQGETDAIIAGAGAQYKSNWTTFINTLIDSVVSYGYPVDKLRIFFWQITDVGGAAYIPAEFAAIKAAQIDLGTNYLIDNPSRTANIRGVTTRTTDDLPLQDAQHYNYVGLDTMGQIEFDYFKLWDAES